ncbi:hypothetical protein FDP41_001763 [Naegleria fowleri]|uniref:TLDc domain-containing protein n=1 Tax=Naegleria fowleri TaxID=5763 RepID=A0A6A5C0N9_NAEFO|nr:uncharacterized protein FDP41_001763 [Naegleria fowleri]KAF0979420.1 hypothetical protein FDP41_001763 [Naegleria fowleri]
MRNPNQAFPSSGDFGRDGENQVASQTSSLITQQQEDQKMTSTSFNYVDLDKIDDYLICPICSFPFFEPVIHATCGNTFCNECADPLKPCPMCREADFASLRFPAAKNLQSQLDKLKVFCPMCKNAVNRGELKDHQEKYCPLHEAYQQVEQMKRDLEKEFEEKMAQFEQEFQERSQKMNMENSLFLEQEKNKLMQEKEEMMKQVEKMKEQLELERKEFEQEKLSRYKLENSNKPIHLNVGGTVMTVSLGHFFRNEREPENLFEKMFTGEYPLYETPCTLFTDKVFFVDCDLSVFKEIYSWMTDGCVEVCKSNKTLRNQVMKKAKSFHLFNLLRELENLEDEDGSSSNTKLKMSQIDFINMVNLSRSQKTTLNLSGMDLRSLVMQNMNLSHCEIIRSNFSKMNLKDLKINNSRLNGCNFSGCDLTNVDFSNCDLRDSNFCGAKLNSTNFTKANLEGCLFDKNTKFISTKLEGVELNNASLKGVKLERYSFSNINFSNCDLSESEFCECTFVYCTFNNSKILSASLSYDFKTVVIDDKTKMVKCQFLNCNLQERSDITRLFIDTTQLINCNVNGCDMSNLDLRGSVFENVTDMNFSNTNLEGCSFKQIILQKLKFNSKTTLSGCKMEQVDLSGCNLSEYNLSKCSFVGCEFSTTILQNTNFCGSSFNNCSFKQVDLRTNILDNNTRATQCNMQQVDLSGQKDVKNFVMGGNSFTNSNLSHCDLSNTVLKGYTFVKCLLAETNFCNSDLSDSVFQEVNLKTIIFNENTKMKACKLIQSALPSSTSLDLSNSTLNKCDLRESEFKQVNFSSCSFNDCQLDSTTIFNSCVLTEVNFDNKNLKGVSFENSNMSKMSFHKTCLQGCNLSGCDLSDSNVKECDMKECILKGSNLQNSIFEHCNLTGCDIQNANTQGMKISNCQSENVFSSSNILNSAQAIFSISSTLKLKKPVSQCSLLYRGSRDGFTAQTFHSRCDSKSPTLTIIKSQHNQIFGGFTTQTWNHTDDCKPDSEAFIFKYHDSTCTFEILPVTRPEKAIYCHSSYLAVFGGISITDKCNENMNCCNLGRSYSLPESLKQQNLKYRDAQVQSYLAGSYKFKVSEIEVYQV